MTAATEELDLYPNDRWLIASGNARQARRNAEAQVATCERLASMDQCSQARLDRARDYLARVIAASEVAS